MDDIYNLEPVDGYFAQEKLNGNCYCKILRSTAVASYVDFPALSCYVGNSTQLAFGGAMVSCPICTETVSGRRFAPHLEKCMNGGKRGSKRHYDYLHDEIGTKALPKPKSSDALDQLDLYPSSLIVRIKLRNGGEIIPRYSVGLCDKLVPPYSTAGEPKACRSDNRRIWEW
jgi:hypothetical protein